MLTDDRSRRSFFSARAPRGSHHAVDPSSHRSRRLRHGRHHRVDDTRPGPDRWSPTGRHTCPAHPQGRARGRVRRGDLRQAAGRLLLEPAALRRRPADHRRGCRAAHQSEQDARLDHEGCTAGRDPRRGVGRTGPEPDRAGRPHDQHVPGGVRHGSARWRSATTARSSSARPRAACGPTTAASRHLDASRTTTPTRSRSAPWPIAPSNDNDRLHGLRRGRAVRRQLVRRRHLPLDRRRHDLAARLAPVLRPGGLRHRGRPHQLPTPVRVHRARPRRQPPHVRADQRAVRRLRVDRRRRHLGAAKGTKTSCTAPPTW